MHKVISFALYGSDTRYTYNAIINCVLAREFFPGWKCRFYIDDTVPPYIVQTLYSFSNTEIVCLGPRDKNTDSINTPVYWRMYAVADPKVDIVICRDADAWLSKRDAIMVQQWLDSDKDFHIIRDHCHHRSPLMAGTYGVRNGLVRDIIDCLRQYIKDGNCYEPGETQRIRNNDQVFLNAVIYPRIISKAFIHGILLPHMPMESCAVDLGPYTNVEVAGYPFEEIARMNGQGICQECHWGEHVGYVSSIIKTWTSDVRARVEQLIAERVNHKHVVSFSLYNSRPKDNIGAIANCMNAPYVYPGWIFRFYVDNTIHPNILHLLKSFPHVEIIQMPTHNGSEAMLWRFLPASDPDVDVMISRDADSWISYRESAMVNEWLQSDKNFHIIRDHCYHSQKIMGGMWGVRNHIVPDMRQLVEKFMETQTYDQGFLATEIYPRVISQALVHDPHTLQSHVIPRAQGYFNDGNLPIPPYLNIDEPETGLSFREANRSNEFNCYHCQKVHETFMGGITEKICERAGNHIKQFADRLGYPVDDLLQEMIPPPRKPKIGVISFVAKTTFPFYIQAMMYKKHMTDPFEFWVVNDADDDVSATEIEIICKKYSVNHFRVPRSIHHGKNANPSESYGRTLTWATQHFIPDNRFDIALINHSDIFPFAQFSIVDYMRGYDIASTMEVKYNHTKTKKVFYLYPAIVMLDMRTLQNIEELTYNCDTIDNDIATDTGGSSYYYLEKYKPKLRHIHYSDATTVPSTEFNRYLTSEKMLCRKGGLRLPWIAENTFYHYIAGTQWDLPRDISECAIASLYQEFTKNRNKLTAALFIYKWYRRHKRLLFIKYHRMRYSLIHCLSTE